MRPRAVAASRVRNPDAGADSLDATWMRNIYRPGSHQENDLRTRQTGAGKIGKALSDGSSSPGEVEARYAESEGGGCIRLGVGPTNVGLDAALTAGD